MSVGFVDGQVALGPSSDVIDYAVVMRRLDESDEASYLLRTGGLQILHLAALADCLARFYRSAERCDESGNPEVVGRLIERNFAEIEHLKLEGITSSQVANLKAFAQTLVIRLRDRLGRRQAVGAIRDGHGDLRLEHVFFPGSNAAPLVIDTVEYEPAFRRGDVALDAAFFAMELRSSGRRDLEAAFWSHFARSMSDYTFFPLIDLYVLYRAAVRAKVAALMAQSPDTPGDVARAKQAECESLWRLAESAVAAGEEGGAVVCVGGLVGAGKSVVAEKLVPRLRGPVISSDYMRKGLAGLSPTDRACDAYYDEAFNRRTLTALLAASRDVLTSGRVVIVDATFRRSSWRQAFVALADEHKVPFVFIEARCREEVLRERLRERQRTLSVSDARESTLSQVAAEFEPLTDLAGRQRFEVDTEQPVGPALDRIAAKIHVPG
ncbi:MAG: AAA family ATPase [Deltaproteobacteria bacterium]|nr:AAA family ATPase [Deltaproteobacteria bacterium]